MSQGSDRRQFLARVAQGTAAAACAGVAWNALLVQHAHAVPYALRPPGAKPEGDFSATCIRCGSCAIACPFGTLHLAKVASGIPAGTPYFVPREEPCHLCPEIPCAKACPTGALERGMNDVTAARMGIAVIDAENCLSWNGLRCEVCYRACPLQGKAITIDTHRRGLSKHAVFSPVVHGDACTGCGLCERACPTRVAAIRILQPSLVQGRIGAHYRMDWKAPSGDDAAQRPARPEAAPTPVAPASAPGANYLNAEVPR
jgi:ferredoxin-type protein NapG